DGRGDRICRPRPVADLAGRTDAGDGLDHRRAGVAHPAARHRHHPRRPLFHPAGHPRRRASRWRWILAPSFSNHRAIGDADHAGCAPVRHHIHLHRLDRGVRAHARRSLRHDSGDRELGVLHRHPGRRLGRWGGHLAVPLSGARRRRGPVPLVCPPSGGHVTDANNRVPGLNRVAAKAGHAGLLVFFVTFLAFPFYWMLITAFKTTQDLHNTAYNPYLFNDPPTLHHIAVLFEDTQFAQWLVNTGFVGIVVVAITLMLALPAGYALARMTSPWAQTLGIGIFLTYLVPPTILFIPFSRIIALLGLQDSLWSLVLVYPSFTVPFCTWLLMGFFKTIPRDLEDAAMVDGLSRLGAFFKVVMPISIAGILTTIIFTFTLVTQEFVYGVTFVTSSSSYTVSVGIPTFLVRGDVYFWGSMMAACLIASIPIAIIYNLFVDRFVAGFTVGAVK